MAFLFSAYVCFNNNKHGAFLVFVSICMISSLYHACKDGSFDNIDTFDGYCMLGYDLPFEYYYRLDFFTTQMTIPVVVWYILRPFKLFVLIKKKSNLTRFVDSSTTDHFIPGELERFRKYKHYSLFGRFGKMKRIVLSDSVEYCTTPDISKTNDNQNCGTALIRFISKRAGKSLKYFFSNQKEETKKKKILHDKHNPTIGGCLCEKKIFKIASPQINNSNDTMDIYRFDDSLTYECVSMPTVFKTLENVIIFGKSRSPPSNDEEHHSKISRRFKFVTGSWYAETAYLIISAIVLWEFIDYFGPSVTMVTIPLTTIHLTFVLVVLFTDKVVHSRHKIDLINCNNDEHSHYRLNNDYADEYMFGYDTYNSLRLSICDKRYDLVKSANNTVEYVEPITIDTDFTTYKKKKTCSTNMKKIYELLTLDHGRVITGCIVGILGLNLFEIQDHIDPNYYPVIHEFWHLLMATAFYLLFFNSGSK